MKMLLFIRRQKIQLLDSSFPKLSCGFIYRSISNSLKELTFLQNVMLYLILKVMCIKNATC